jgi:GNAT superfamily N-acetyltransferase
VNQKEIARAARGYGQLRGAWVGSRARKRARARSLVHRADRTLMLVMWTVCAEPVDSPDAVALLRDYFAELTVRYFHRETTEQEIDETLDEFPSTGLALFLVLRAGGVPAGCLGLHPTGELTRIYVVPQLRRAGGARALLSAAESWARTQGLTRLFLDTRTDLVEARAFYASCGFIEILPPTTTPSQFQDHWFEKPLT